MSLEQIKNIMHNNYFDEVHLTGFIDSNENDDAEFVANMKYVFLEFGQNLIKFEAIEQYSKISLSVAESIQVIIDIEDVTPAKTSIGNLIFDNSLIDNKVAEIVFFNMNETNDNIVCDALKLVLVNRQELFFDPSFLGFNIGNSAVEELWRDNQKGYCGQEFTINFKLF